MTKDITVAVIGNTFLNADALRRTLKNIDCKEVITFSPEPIDPYALHIPLVSSFSRDDFSLFSLKNLWAHIRTEHVLLVHYDAQAVKKEFWTDDFLNYDYIGAPWPEEYSWIQPHERVGNGGFSLRSRKLLEALKDPEIKIVPGNDRTENEDAVICQSARQLLIDKYQINFAPVDVAHQFSQELCLDRQGQTFGFHGLWNLPFYLSEDEIIYYLENTKQEYWSLDRAQMFWNNCLTNNCQNVLQYIKDNFISKQ